MSSRTQEFACLTAGGVVLAGLVLYAFGCTDTGGRYDAFLERTADLRGADAGASGQGDRFDFSGRYLLALSTAISPTDPILLRCDVTVAEDLSRATFVLQPLTTDEDEAPRDPIGDAVSVAADYTPDGMCFIDLGSVQVPGRANPISGAPIVADVQLVAETRAARAALPQLLCGQLSGAVSEPLSLDLEGSTFGAVLTDGAPGVEPLLRCP